MKQKKSWAESLLHLVSYLPLWWLYRLSDLLFPLAYYVVRYRRNVVRQNLRKSFPELTEREREIIAFRFYRFFCDYAVETVKLMTISKEEMKRRMKFVGIEKMDAELKKQPFCFLMLGHYANWEWISSLPLWSDQHCGQLYNPLHNKLMDTIFFHMRTRMGAENISKYDAYRRILTLKREKTPTHIGFISDQSPSPLNIHDWVTFLHQDTPIFTGAERIGKHVGAAAYFAHVERPRRGYYECHVELLTSDMKEYDDFKLSELFMRRLEREIRECPHMWLWTHRRWKYTREKVAAEQGAFHTTK